MIVALSDYALKVRKVLCIQLCRFSSIQNRGDFYTWGSACSKKKINYDLVLKIRKVS